MLFVLDASRLHLKKHDMFRGIHDGVRGCNKFEHVETKTTTQKSGSACFLTLLFSWILDVIVLHGVNQGSGFKNML